MDSNYEAQKHLASQRLASRREQAAAERMLRNARPVRTGGLMQLFARLFQRSGQRKGEKLPQRELLSKPAIAGQGKR